MIGTGRPASLGATGLSLSAYDPRFHSLIRSTSSKSSVITSLE
jgi:hypothetical protein